MPLGMAVVLGRLIGTKSKKQITLPVATEVLLDASSRP